MTTTANCQQSVNVASASSPAIRVILVEDDHDLRQSIADYLRLRGNDVTDVSSGLGFYKAMSYGAFDVAILDINLPDISGFELARGVAAAGRRMGVIILSARAHRNDRIQGYAEGADLYLTKPVDGEELSLAISNLAQRVQVVSQPPAISSTRDVSRAWRIELDRRRLVSPQGVSIPLSGRETMLMEGLARSEGATLSRTAIAALFGHENSDPESRRLDAALRRLRLKARQADADLPLQIIHAIGVRFTQRLEIF